MDKKDHDCDENSVCGGSLKAMKIAKRLWSDGFIDGSAMSINEFYQMVGIITEELCYNKFNKLE